MQKTKVLLVDDDQELLRVYSKIFKLHGFDIVACSSGEAALERLAAAPISVVITDIIMPRMSGMELLKKINAAWPCCEVIMLTAEGSIAEAVQAMKQGAFSYFVKPADIDEMISSVKKAQELANAKGENSILRERIAEASWKETFIGTSDMAEQLRKKAEMIGQTDSTVLITGETGTGKEVIANLIHASSKRAREPFVCVNCGALNENLIEAELFGSEKGAYTGAEKQRKGRFEAANGGTIFFDEIGELSLSMQVSLLRVLQEKTFERVGGSVPVYSDFRLIAATNRNLREEVSAGRFRMDLYYRLNIIPIEVPPLRERKVDIKDLSLYFFERYAREMNRKMRPLSSEILRAFWDYDWPGNVRELRNIIERLIVLSADGDITPSDLPEEIKEAFTREETKTDTGVLKEAMRDFEKKFIERVLIDHHGNITKTAEELGIARKNLYKKLSDYEIRYKE